MKKESEMRCGLLGRKLGHSFSPQIHSVCADYSYELFEVEPEDADDFIKNGDYDCMNVTIPYKENAYRVCDVLSLAASEMKSVNTVVRGEDGKLYGYNTDYRGFTEMLLRYGAEIEGRDCLVLGSGGASKTCVFALKNLNAKSVTVVSRSGEINYDNVYELKKDVQIIINATPVGMYPNNDARPIDLSRFPKCEFVGDIIYNPAITRLIEQAQELGIPCANGLYMLASQGAKASEIFTGKTLPPEITDKIVKTVENETKNIVLIGMPGSGKSTLGRGLARVTKREFVDIDIEIEKRTGKAIPDIFKESGEDEFRRIETEVTKDILKRSGLVVATGGGVVTREENKYWVRCNSNVVWVKRDIFSLPTDGRPVSQSRKIEDIYNQRKANYESWSDIVYEDNRVVKFTNRVADLRAKAILSKLGMYTHTFSIYTLGCKVNTYDSEALADFLEKTGRYKKVDNDKRSEADIFIVNSCAVTEESEKKAAKIIRRAKRENPANFVILCGCMPQASPERASKTEADVITGNKNRRKTLEILDEMFFGVSADGVAETNRKNYVDDHTKGEAFEVLSPSSYRSLTRANLKIQDGCNRFCAYCIIPFARGPVRSMPLDELKREAEALVKAGHREIVLTGINLGMYGSDIGEKLTTAVETVKNAGAERIRFGSLEADLLTDDLLTPISKIEGFCPQFHVSLQSGSDTVLKRMHRRYTGAEYMERINRLRELFPNATITTDVIVGFPGETEREFEESCEFVKKAGFFKVHVFPFSSREGTVAANLPDHVKPSVKKARAQKMGEIAEKLHEDYMKNHIGEKVRVLFETREDGFWLGHSEEYFYVKTETNKNLKNEIADVVITGVDGEIAVGEIAK